MLERGAIFLAHLAFPNGTKMEPRKHEQFSFPSGPDRRWLSLSSQSHPVNFDFRRRRFRSAVETVGKLLP